MTHIVKTDDTNIKYRKAKFSWAEVFSNSTTGKSSATALAGIACICVGLIGFIASFVLMFMSKLGSMTAEATYQSIILIGIGASLLGIRKLAVGRKGLNMSDNNDHIRRSYNNEDEENYQ